ncbi:hypothetical protein DYE50_01335 [Treponema ruminis]|uniref:Uncharacterized protein n=1 Tax=Treponema ruminis TaxID=744515 RepID=A0A7W8LNE1_9SPIR|nr:hypothetical protein [Treponema ruminis]MBB5227417.1 hypothetical protein [Treponema ruminis]QSI01226.1 hypothetical protein DYE50_01335 [Treponema ruminis]
MERSLVTLQTLSGGAANDYFENAMKEVIDNIRDINTPAKSPRRITLTLCIKPTEDRLMAQTELSVKTFLPPIKPFSKSMFFAREKDGVHAYEENVEQPILPFPEISRQA